MSTRWGRCGVPSSSSLSQQSYGKKKIDRPRYLQHQPVEYGPREFHRGLRAHVGAAQEAAVHPGGCCLCLGDCWFSNDSRELEIGCGFELRKFTLLFVRNLLWYCQETRAFAGCSAFLRFLFLSTYVLNFCVLTTEQISVHLLSSPLMLPLTRLRTNCGRTFF